MTWNAAFAANARRYADGGGGRWCGLDELRLCLSYYAPSLPDRFLRFYAYSNPSKRYPNLPPGNLGGFPLIGQAIHLMRSDSCAPRKFTSSERVFQCSYLRSVKAIMRKWSMLSITGGIHREMRSMAVKFTSSVKLRTLFIDIHRQAVEILGG
ncbi:hypothetical protein HPP92_018784 [Vanilla planifolia]|uniref:Uncharacterized protein n=1 Tax=Vanilla planifolia TaxID=51239 RepID=A0A835QCP4_VANPL|nr:hypothetical protein HPP92_018784 [Vanilla planifolia]